MHENTLQPGKNSDEFLEKVFAHVAKVFPSKHVHIGGDEAPTNQWTRSFVAQKTAQQFFEKLGEAESTHVQKYFTHKVSDILQKKGKTPSAWDEVLHTGGAPSSTVITAWRSTDEVRRALDSGHKTINAVQEYLYFDHYQTSGR